MQWVCLVADQTSLTELARTQEPVIKIAQQSTMATNSAPEHEDDHRALNKPSSAFFNASEELAIQVETFFFVFFWFFSLSALKRLFLG